MALAGPATAADAPWAWPVQTDPQAITGTFMESRETRFHTGLDIRTAGRTGLPVRSPVDGEVRRIRSSARGYGLALYIGTADGLTVVFAHLDRFFLPAAELLRDAQASSGSYEQDLAVGAGRIPVRAGEVVALSGETGTGAPHLHVEVRDARERPLNPADFFALPDMAAPEIRAVRLVPAGSGQPAPIRLEPGATQEPVPALGTWIVEALVIDRTGTAPFTVAPRGIELFTDGELRYALRHEAVSFADAGQMRLDQRRDEDGRWYRLHRRSGLSLPGREGEGGLLEVAGAPTELRVVASDSDGREAEARFRLLPEMPAPDLATPGLRVHDRILAAVVPESGPGAVPELRGPGFVRALGRVAGGWVLALPHEDLPDGRWSVIAAGEVYGGPAELRFAAGGLSAFLPEDAPGLVEAAEAALYPGGALELRVVEAGPVPGMRPVGRALEVRSHDLVPRRPLEYRTPPGAPAHSCLMRHDGRRWTWVETKDGRGRSDAFGLFALMEDLVPPEIGRPEGPAIVDGVVVVTRGPDRAVAGVPVPAWPPVRIPVRDEGSGLPDTGPEVLLDGRPWPARYDGEEETLVLDGFVEPPAGRHRIEVVATDRSGRRARRSFEVEFRR